MTFRKPLLTVFTPTYNRAHTLPRTYESLCKQTSKDFEWLIIDDGSTDNTKDIVDGWKKDELIPIIYVYKDNGGLYTGYNTAYSMIETELCVCIDSDDFMPLDAVENIVNTWRKYGSDKYAGITGLDFSLDGYPIGGFFPEEHTEGHIIDLYIKKIHIGDTKQVMRTKVMRTVSPMIGFSGEKFFNPIYLLLKADDIYPSLFLNKNLCFVDYQYGKDSMSSMIYKQYLDSPRSFSKMRILEMTLRHNTRKNLIRVCIHYNSSTIISKDKQWLSNSPRKYLTILTRPLGWILSKYIFLRAKKCK